MFVLLVEELDDLLIAGATIKWMPKKTDIANVSVNAFRLHLICVVLHPVFAGEAKLWISQCSIIATTTHTESHDYYPCKHDTGPFTTC